MKNMDNVKNKNHNQPPVAALTEVQIALKQHDEAFSMDRNAPFDDFAANQVQASQALRKMAQGLLDESAELDTAVSKTMAYVKPILQAKRKTEKQRAVELKAAKLEAKGAQVKLAQMKHASDDLDATNKQLEAAAKRERDLKEELEKFKAKATEAELRETTASKELATAKEKIKELEKETQAIQSKTDARSHSSGNTTPEMIPGLPTGRAARSTARPTFDRPSNTPQHSLGPTPESLSEELDAASLNGGGRSPATPAQPAIGRQPVFGAASSFSSWSNPSPFGSVSAWSRQPAFGSNLSPNSGVTPPSGSFARSTFGAPTQRAGTAQTLAATSSYGQFGARSSNRPLLSPFQFGSSLSIGQPAGRGQFSRRNDDGLNPLADDLIPEGGEELVDTADGKRPRSKGSSSLQSEAVRRKSRTGIPIIPRDNAIPDGHARTASRSPSKAPEGPKPHANRPKGLRQFQARAGEDVDPSTLPLTVMLDGVLIPIDEMEDQDIAEELQERVNQLFVHAKGMASSRHHRWVNAKRGSDWCYHALAVGRNKPSTWFAGHKRTHACTTCTNAGRPCIIHEDGQVIILPVLADEPDWDNLRAWVIPENASPKKKKPAQAT